MHHTKDLHIKRDILPLFDFTLNDYSRSTLLYLLETPLNSIYDIEQRQKILKGFIGNLSVLKHYSYSRADFYEVQQLLANRSDNNDKISFWHSSKKKDATKSRYIQFVTLFHYFQQQFLGRIDNAIFPAVYALEVTELNNFLTPFNLDFYATAIREDRFTYNHIRELNSHISNALQSGAVATFYQKLYLFEAYVSISIGIVKNNFQFPELSKADFSINGLFHPLLKKPIRNHLTWKRNVIIFTGPNMSGKSTLLKAIGLCVYMAHLGIAVPAADAAIPFFHHFTFSLNHADDMVNGYSHFSSELKQLKNVVEIAARQSCFAIFDELFTGTNIDDAVNISTTTINGLTRYSKSIFVISTHLHQLIEPVTTGQVETYYLDCTVEQNQPVFNYQVKPGWSSLQLGQILFEKEGLHKLLTIANTNNVHP